MILIFAVKVISWMVMNMTTDEAISVLNKINDLFGAEYENTNPMIAIEMAIEALQFQQDQKEIDAKNYDREMRDREE